MVPVDRVLLGCFQKCCESPRLFSELRAVNLPSGSLHS